MTKKELAKKIAEDQVISQKQAVAIVDSVFDSIAATVAAGEKVSIPGFGIFATKTRAARTGRNPRTKETVEIPASTVPVFKAGKEFKEKVNG